MSRSGWIPWPVPALSLAVTHDHLLGAMIAVTQREVGVTAAFAAQLPSLSRTPRTTVRIERGFRVLRGDIKRSPTHAAQRTCARRFGSELFKSANPRQARLRRASFPRVCLLNASYAVLSSS